MLAVTVIYAVLCLGAFFLEEAPEEIQERKSGANEHLENASRCRALRSVSIQPVK